MLQFETSDQKSEVRVEFQPWRSFKLRVRRGNWKFEIEWRGSVDQGPRTVPLLGLKARNIIAWAEASLRAKAQVTDHQNSPALKGRNRSLA